MLKRKILGSVRFVCKFDPAVDHAACSYESYVSSDFNEENLAFVTGAEPTVWTIAPLTRRQKSLVAQFKGRQRWEILVQCGLRAVSGYGIVDEHGQTTELGPPQREPWSAVPEMGPMITDAWLDKANLLDQELEAVAEAVWAITEVRPLS